MAVSIIDPLIEALHQAKGRVGLRPVLYLQLSLNHYVLYSLIVRKLTLRTGQGRLNFVVSPLPPPLPRWSRGYPFFTKCAIFRFRRTENRLRFKENRSVVNENAMDSAATTRKVMISMHSSAIGRSFMHRTCSFNPGFNRYTGRSLLLPALHPTGPSFTVCVHLTGCYTNVIGNRPSATSHTR